jgi:hypothetical protein
MAIDKIKLRGLAKDKDERFFAEGDMLDARNVTMSTDGETSGGVVKNTKGTVPGSAATTDDQIPNEESRVVGSVANDAKNKVYFFVWSTSASNHGIYEYDASNDTYRAILVDSVLGFDKFGFVKADIINGDFRKNSTEEAILYFTDNVNPPRRINVDRSADLSSYSLGELEHAISLIKTPSLFPPTVTLATESGRTTNNLYGTVLQFAIQYVYKDGESSALSPHSKVVYPKYMGLQGIVDSDVAGTITEENVALVNTRWVNGSLNPYKKEVSKIRILSRTVNTNPFFIVDEFDPNSDLSKNSNIIYSSASGIYKFYNDGLYLYESGAVTDKVFDDVPHKAVGQAISGNRLMLSSPTSGYPNVPVTATLSVDYEDTPSSSFVDSDNSTTLILHAQNVAAYDNEDGSLKIDLSSLNSTVPANTTVRIFFEYKPTSFWNWGYYDAGGGSTPADNELYNVLFNLDSGGVTSLKVGEAENSQSISLTGDIGTQASPGHAMGAITTDISHEGMSYRGFEASVFVEEATAKADVIAKLSIALSDQIARYSYSSNTDLVTWYLRASTGGDFQYQFLSKELDFDLSFSCVADGNYIKASPRTWNYELPQGDLYSGLNSGFGVSSQKTSLRPFNNITATGVAGSCEGMSEVTFFSNSVTAPKRTLAGFPLSSVFDFWFDYDFTASGSPLTITNQNDGAKSYEMIAFQSFARRTFKAGSTHKFGVVYFDEFGRCGNVNEIGDVYVKPFGDSVRDGKNGPCTISVDFTSQPPDWAVSYQIVYSDMGSWEKFETFVVGGGFYKKVDGIDDSTPTTETDKIYLSLNTLTKQQEKGSLKDYVYTPGDKLRIINYRDTHDAASETYFAGSDSNILNVNGIEVFTTNIDLSAPADAVHTNKVGKFLAVSTQDGQNITNFVPSGTNKWDNECLVEVLTPRKDPPTEIFYEIAESRAIYGVRNLSDPSNNKHNDGNPIPLTEGSVYMGLRSVVTPNIYGSNTYWSATNIEDFDFDARIMESMDASDYVPSRCWSKGRAHVKYDKAATISYPNRIVYSDEFVDQLESITFSSFNPGSNSFKDMPRSFGSVNYIEEYNQGLVSIQENKLSYIPVKRNIIEYADGSSAITANASVLGTHKEANGDFGIGSDQSSALVRDGMVFFVDKSRQKSMMASGTNMISISDIEMSSFLEAEISSMEAATGSGGRIISGYDPDENVYLLTIEPKVSGASTTYAGATIGYSISDKRWISRYDFKPSNYCSIDNKILSGFWYQNADDTQSYLFNNHKSTTMNTFYGTAYPTSVKVISKMSPSEVKVFNAVSYEGSGNGYAITSGITTNLGQTSDIPVTFTEKEGSFYSAFPRDTSTKYTYLGTLASRIVKVCTMSDYPRFNKLGSKITGQGVYFLDSGAYSAFGSVDSYDQSSGTITLLIEPSVDDSTGKQIYFEQDVKDTMRGNWAEIELTNSLTTPHELYCVNTHITSSKLHHPLGQQ